MAGILKTLAIAASTGVAVGIYTTAGGRRAPRVAEPEAALDLEPLLDRIEAIERRAEAPAPAEPAVAPEAIAELARRIDEQDAQIVRLREIVDQRTAETQQKAIAAVEAKVEARIAERLAPHERTLADQGASIQALRDRAESTDVNLQRLIVAIERLCERPQAPAVSAAVPGPTVLPFEKHLEEAATRESEAKPEEDAVPEFRARIFKEAEIDPKRIRVPFARIFGMIALLVLTQTLT